MINQLPTIKHKKKKYFFDYRLQELREINTLRSIFLNNTELELLSYAIEKNSLRLIKLNMLELEYKL